MKSFFEKLKEKLADHLIALLATTFAGFISAVAKYSSPYIVGTVDPLSLFWLVVGLIILCLALVAYIFAQRPKYRFIKELDIYQEKKTGNYFCPSCMANGKKSHLKEHDNGWQCMTNECNRRYYKPGKEPKPPERRVISKGIDNGWVNKWKIW